MASDNSVTMPNNSTPSLDPLTATNTDSNPLSATPPNPDLLSDTGHDSMNDSDEEEDQQVVIALEGDEVSNMEALSISTSRNDRIAALLDELIKATMSGKRPSEGIPELVFMLACPMHGPDPGLGKGLFKIADKGLGKMSVSQLLTWWWHPGPS